MSYSLLHLLHLLGAIGFIGALFYEVAILDRVRVALPGAFSSELSQAVGKRSRQVLHAVVLLVYGAGLGLAWHHREVLAQPFASSFATLLSLKILLALLVFLSFGLVAVLLRRGAMTPVLYRRLHALVLAQMLVIVVLAKAMFFVHW
ncbi:hypothetical protein HW090_07605 [Pseudomonas sp. ABC1]|uniref:hypothetical protein n=1 Tax=Pseudomonas sp. ABC1 TaxID=2748080 RepID=UPI0015C3050F|nr:hypothetical protein [Pseudomonas sp. ABC1]QLF93059.1 hypothetical protein HW090_07605 [Pseudomonas sp. ABC1]